MGRIGVRSNEINVFAAVHDRSVRVDAFQGNVVGTSIARAGVVSHRRYHAGWPQGGDGCEEFQRKMHVK